MLTDPQSNFFSFSCSFWGCATQPATASSFGSPVIIPLYHGHCIVSNRESKPKYAHLSMNVKVSKVFNETVSLEDTVIGLHTLQLQLVILGEGVYSWLLKTQSPTFWPTFHFQVGGGWWWWRWMKCSITAWKVGGILIFFGIDNSTSLELKVIMLGKDNWHDT